MDRALHRHLGHFNNGETRRSEDARGRWRRLKGRDLCWPPAASFLTAGTTATVALLRDGVELAVGSAGDSRAMLCRKGRATKLSTDHTPDRKDERRR